MNCAYSSRRGDVAGSSISMSVSGMFARARLHCSIAFSRLPSNASARRSRPSTQMRAARDDLRLFALGEHDALRIADRPIDQPAHHTARAAKSCLETLAVFVEIQELVRDAGRDRRPRHRGRDPQQHARIEREGNQIIRSERDFAQPMLQSRNAVRCIFLGEQRQRARRRHLHLFIDLRGAYVECTAENEREAEDVVDLIRIVAAPRGDDRIGTHGTHFFRKRSRVPDWRGRR